MLAPVARRLNITLAVKRLVRDAAARLPDLAHVDAARLLVVAGEARRASRATIRPAAQPGQPRIRVRGRDIRYVITLRPLWFLDSTPEGRVETVLHEDATVALFGRAGGTYAGDTADGQSGRWEAPAAWLAEVRDGRVAKWRVYADNLPMRRLMGLEQR